MLLKLVQYCPYGHKLYAWSVYCETLTGAAIENLSNFKLHT